MLHHPLHLDIMPKLNLSQAAHVAGISRTTIYRHIRKGKISTEKDRDGNPVIDTSEIERVYGMKHTNTPKEQHAIQVDTTQAQDLRKQIEFLQAQLEDAKEERNRLLGIIEKQTLAITGPPPAHKTGLLARLFGGK